MSDLFALRPKPTARLVAAIALGFPVLLLAPVWHGAVWLVLAWDAALVLLFAFEVRGLRRVARVQIERIVPTRLSVGAWSQVRLVVASDAPVPLSVRLVDAYPPEFDLGAADTVLSLGPHGRGDTVYRVRPHARGDYAFGDVAVELGAKAAGRLGLGLASLRGRAVVGGVAKVYPDLRAMRMTLAAHHPDLAASGPRATHRGGSGDEFDKLRDYLPDDDYRDIHWKATAKRSRPVTQIFAAERSQRVILAVDCGRSMAGRAEDQTKLDLAVEAALALGQVALAAGDLVGLVLFASEVRGQVAAKRGMRHFARIVEALHAVREELTYVDYQALARELLGRRHRRALVVVYTDLLDEAAARPLVEAARLLARRHAVAVVAPSDPVLHAAARARAATARDVYRALAAREALADRRTLIETVRRLGVHVVDARSAELAARGVDSYLEMKRRRAI